MDVFEKISAQQKGKEDTIIWEVGEQLKEICRADSHCAEIVAADLENPDMSIEKAERQIKAWADKQKRVGNGVGVPGIVADRILREFYGLPAAGTAVQDVVPDSSPAVAGAGFLDLDTFL